MRETAPIALFCYNRPNHLMRTIEALKANALSVDSDLHIFCDGAKNKEDMEAVNEVRRYVSEVSGFRNIVIYERDVNLGLANSIVTGVSQLVRDYGKVIVMEDDILTAPFFLTYMNEGLTVYENENDVISIHGYLLPVKKTLPETFFLRGADCWGWATWKRGWDLFNPNGQSLLDQIESLDLQSKFDMGGSYPYTKMLEEWTQGKNDSWAIRWHASAFIQKKLTLYPGSSLVLNIGNDGSGTHSGDERQYDAFLCKRKIAIKNIKIEECNDAVNAIKKLHKKNIGIFESIKKLIKKNKKNPKWKQSYGWFATNLSWEKATERCGGYESSLIMETCRNALLQVSAGTAAHERDSVLFDQVEYSWPLLTGLMMSAAHSEGRINVIDIGGSLGSTFFQNRKFLKHFSDVMWNIVEQESFVECGKSNFESSVLKFYKSISDCLSENTPTVAVMSSVVQYVEFPYELLDQIVKSRVPFIIFDRTSFSNCSSDILSIQKVNPSIYKASYPAWFLDKEKFINKMCESYDLVETFNSLSNPITVLDKKKKIHFEELGFIFRLKTNRI